MNQVITASNLIKEINCQIKHSTARHLLIFDLDDTIFNTSYRRFYVYEFLLRPQFDLPKINLNSFKNSYNFIPFIKNHPSFKINHSKIINIRNRMILSNFLLYLDQPYFGVSKFLKHLNGLNVDYIFLTGRPEGSMKVETNESLGKFGLINPNFVQNYLLMKKNRFMPDNIFKKIELTHILDLFPERKIIIFDNESENCREFNEVLPNDAIVVRFNAVQKKVCHFQGMVLNTWLS